MSFSEAVEDTITEEWNFYQKLVNLLNHFWMIHGNSELKENRLLSPVKTRGYRVELVRLSVRPSVRLSVPLEIGYFVHASWV